MRTTHVILGAGPVGRAVVAALVTRGIEPAVVTRSGVTVTGAVSRRADLADSAAAIEALAGAHVVYQCAQPAYHRWPEQFPGLQSCALEATAAAGALFVAAENLYGYGPATGPITEELPLDATTAKGVVRARMWRALEAAHDAGHVRVVAARASDFFGPMVRASAVGSRFFGPLVAGRRVHVVGNPDRLHTYTYVPDFGEAMVRLSETPATWGRAWHVPNPPTTSTREFAELAADIAGSTARLHSVGRWQVRLVGAVVPAVREITELLYEFEDDWVVGHGRYAAILGDHATPIDEALRATVTH
jgi:nucleoside-diphosphate-sugar epimerase